MASNYREVITMLQERYYRLHLLHQDYVCAIVEEPSLTDGSAKELRGLHDILMQHLQALKVIDYEPGMFITSLTEMKLN